MAKDVIPAETREEETSMYQRSIFRICGLGFAGLLALSGGAVGQGEQKPAKDLITGNWNLMIADHVRSDGNKVPGFGPLPQGTAKFGPDGRYSLEVMPNSRSHAALSYSGTYTLDDAGKTISLRVEESSQPNWRGKTQTGAVKFITGEHLGWTSSVPLSEAADVTGTELIWTRSK
jgi:Lipocalin-like domain